MMILDIGPINDGYLFVHDHSMHISSHEYAMRVNMYEGSSEPFGEYIVA